MLFNPHSPPPGPLLPPTTVCILKNVLENNEFFSNLLSDNYVLSGLTAGQYALYSPVQTENGPRLFYSLFGFWYKGKNTKITARLFRTTQTFDLTPSPYIFADDLRWMYFSENITTILKSTSWASYTDKEWQVTTEYQTF